MSKISTSSTQLDRNNRFLGRRVYLTGAASGIGRATAHLLAAEGARLALIDVDPGGLEAVARETGGAPFIVDLRSGDAVDNSVMAAADRMGGLDCVLNIAAVTDGSNIDDLSPDRWEAVMAINLTAPYRICKAALPYLKAATGSTIVNVASGEAVLPSAAGTPAYSASKGGLLSFTRALAAGLAPVIRANAVIPGLTDTPMMAPYIHGDDKGAARDVIERYAMRRPAEPREIAEAIAFLASSESSYVTGITFAVDGGRTYY